MYLSLLLFVTGVLGFVLNRRNLILMLISIEIMLLAITYLILVSSVSFDDILGQTYAIYVISIAGAESAIGLAIFVAFYRLRGSVSIDDDDTDEYPIPNYTPTNPSFMPPNPIKKDIGVRRFSTSHSPTYPFLKGRGAGAGWVDLIKNKEHLDLDSRGLQEILEIKSGMNKGRVSQLESECRLRGTVEIEDF
jgi:NADH-ubiquinone oxidoreductase chain 4L